MNRQKTLLEDKRGQGAIQLFLMIVGVLGLVYVVSSLFSGGLPVQKGCSAIVNGLSVSFPCNQIPFEVTQSGAAITVGTQPTQATTTGTSGVTYTVNVSNISFTVNPLEKYLNGTAAPTMTVSPRVNGSWLADFNTAVGMDLPVQNPFEYLVGKDTGSGTDYYNNYITGRNSGLIDPLTDSLQFAREGALTSTATNQDNVTLNANSVAGISSIAASQTYYWNLKEDMLTAYASYGNPMSKNKVLVVVDYNALDFSKVSPYGIAYSSGAGVPPTHTRDGNATTSVAYIVPALGLDYINSAASFKVKAEALSSGLTVSGQQQRVKLTFYDYQVFKNTETGVVEDMPYNPVTSTDVGASNSNVTLYYRTT